METTLYRSSAGLLSTSIYERNSKKLVKKFVNDGCNRDLRSVDKEVYNPCGNNGGRNATKMIHNHQRKVPLRRLEQLGPRPPSILRKGKNQRHAAWQGGRPPNSKRCQFVDEALRLPIVTETWTRPRTRSQDCGRFYYTERDFDRFEREAGVKAENEDAMNAAIVSSSSTRNIDQTSRTRFAAAVAATRRFQRRREGSSPMSTGAAAVCTGMGSHGNPNNQRKDILRSSRGRRVAQVQLLEPAASLQQQPPPKTPRMNNPHSNYKRMCIDNSLAGSRMRK
mmetsp:Transcript_4382/g.9464  ORF Transcript_4382/g.9464 Transcript_4382/m.9464 type:complete len:280 (+) Transcript_4382:98-937(+)